MTRDVRGQVRARMAQIVARPPEPPPQLTLFDASPEFVVPTVHAKATHAERFEAFHAANPWVYVALVRLARDEHERGAERCGMKYLFEVLRWHYRRATSGDPEFKLNNNLTSRYARLIAKQEADLADLFELRELKAA